MSGLVLKAANQFSLIFLGTSRSDDSTGDRLSYRYTCALLVAFTVIVSSREITKKRIQCWVPAFFTDNYEDYANNVCWVRNTYHIDDNEDIPEQASIRYQSSIRYYQWIPFILLFQAFFFFLPYALWRALSHRSGIDVRDLVEAATNCRKLTGQKQSADLMHYMVSMIDQYVDDPRRQSDNRETKWWKKCFLILFPSSGRYMGDYLRNLFIFIKILYIINIFGQVLLLSFLLSQPFWSLGFSILKLLYEGRSWDYQSQYFPKVTLCDFQIREANSLNIAHTYTIMCVLPINLFNQQIFTFLWFWLVIVVFFTVYDLCIWIYRLFVRRPTYLIERLKVMDKSSAQKWPFKDSCANHINAEENEHLMKVLSRDQTSKTENQVFVLSDGRSTHHESRVFTVPPAYYRRDRSIFDFFNLEYLEADGHFILRIIAENASDFVATTIIHRLYKLCCEKRFRPYEVVQEKPVPRIILGKYLIISKSSEELATDESEQQQQQQVPVPLPRLPAKNGSAARSGHEETDRQQPVFRRPQARREQNDVSQVGDTM